MEQEEYWKGQTILSDHRLIALSQLKTYEDRAGRRRNQRWDNITWISNEDCNRPNKSELSALTTIARMNNLNNKGFNITDRERIIVKQRKKVQPNTHDPPKQWHIEPQKQLTIIAGSENTSDSVFEATPIYVNDFNWLRNASKSIDGEAQLNIETIILAWDRNYWSVPSQ